MKYRAITNYLTDLDEELTVEGKASLRRLLKKAEKYGGEIGSDEVSDFAEIKEIYSGVIFQYLEDNNIEIERNIQEPKTYRYKPQVFTRAKRGGDCSKIINEIDNNLYYVPSQGG